MTLMDKSASFSLCIHFHTAQITSFAGRVAGLCDKAVLHQLLVDLPKEDVIDLVGQIGRGNAVADGGELGAGGDFSEDSAKLRQEQRCNEGIKLLLEGFAFGGGVHRHTGAMPLHVAKMLEDGQPLIGQRMACHEALPLAASFFAQFG